MYKAVVLACYPADLAFLEQPEKVHRTLAEISKPTRSIILAAAGARRAS
jgi:hypothetical protein